MGIIDHITQALDQFEPESLIDITAIAVVIYVSLLVLKDTTAMSLIRGIIIVVIGAVLITTALDLTVLSWLLRNSFPAILLLIPIIFQGEIRRFLERLSGSVLVALGLAVVRPQ